MNSYDEHLKEHRHTFWYYQIPRTDKIIEKIIPSRYRFEIGERTVYKVGKNKYNSFEEALEMEAKKD